MFSSSRGADGEFFTLSLSLHNLNSIFLGFLFAGGCVPTPPPHPQPGMFGQNAAAAATSAALQGRVKVTKQSPIYWIWKKKKFNLRGFSVTAAQSPSPTAGTSNKKPPTARTAQAKTDYKPFTECRAVSRGRYWRSGGMGGGGLSPFLFAQFQFGEAGRFVYIYFSLDQF